MVLLFIWCNFLWFSRGLRNRHCDAAIRVEGATWFYCSFYSLRGCPLLGRVFRFSKSVSILSNRAQWTGGAMWVASGATVEFRKPGKVSIGYNSVVDEVSTDEKLIGVCAIPAH